VGIVLEFEAESCTIRLEGVIGIESACELKEHLAQGLQCGREVRISLEGATDLDVTAMQLLWAAGCAATAAGVSFGLVGHQPQEIAVAFGDAGFDGIAMIATTG
jgi:anti-anti-sigma regulatory factor